MEFEQVLARRFPGFVNERDFVSETARALAPLGFTRDTAIATAGTCRDEITQPLVECIRAEWGEAFNMASLAGLPFAGKTAFGAAQAHSPIADGQENYVFYGLTHVAIGRAGEPGIVEREGREEPSTACGALLALLGELREGRLGSEQDPDDLELSLLRMSIGRRVSAGELPDLFGLTELTLEVLFESYLRILDASVDTQRANYALITGIQIHAPGRRNYVQPGAAFAMVDGQRQPLTLTR